MTTLSQAIRNAIDAEHAAARFYALLADSTEDAAAKEFLEHMAEQERAHARAIEAMTELHSTSIAEKADLDVSTIETVPTWKHADGLSLEQALALALEAERQAALYYDAFADQVDEPVATFFRNLAKVEEDHVSRLETKARPPRGRRR